MNRTTMFLTGGLAITVAVSVFNLAVGALMLVVVGIVAFTLAIGDAFA